MSGQGFGSSIRLLEIAAEDAEDMSEWEDRKVEHGPALKARAREYRRAALVLSKHQLCLNVTSAGQRCLLSDGHSGWHTDGNHAWDNDGRTTPLVSVATESER